jgi:hypothetical protein
MAAAYQQVDFVTESKKTGSHGGKRNNSGRKLKYNEQTAVIRLPISVVERIKAHGFDAPVTPDPSPDDINLQAELEKYKAANLKVVTQCDKYHQRSIDLDAQVHTLKRQADQLRAEITRLKHLEQDCQAIKDDGIQCDRTAKVKVKVNGIAINVCLQHNNQLVKIGAPLPN